MLISGLLLTTVLEIEAAVALWRRAGMCQNSDKHEKSFYLSLEACCPVCCLPRMQKIIRHYIIFPSLCRVECDWVHLGRRPPVGLSDPCWMMLVDVCREVIESELTGETEILGEVQSQCHFLHHKSHMNWPQGSRDISLIIVSRLWAGCSVFDSGQRQKILLFSVAPRSTLKTTLPPIRELLIVLT
jgi:hypothetical protein